MFGLGFSEIIVILIVVLLVLGPNHLPGAARSVGKALAEFRRSVDDVKREFNAPLTERPSIAVLEPADDAKAEHANCETKTETPKS